MKKKVTKSLKQSKISTFTHRLVPVLWETECKTDLSKFHQQTCDGEDKHALNLHLKCQGQKK